MRNAKTRYGDTLLIFGGHPYCRMSPVKWLFLHNTLGLLGILCVEADFARLACVRHAASVRPEPGSNSPIKLLTFNQKDQSDLTVSFD